MPAEDVRIPQRNDTGLQALIKKNVLGIEKDGDIKEFEVVGKTVEVSPPRINEREKVTRNEDLTGEEKRREQEAHKETVNKGSEPHLATFCLSK